MRSRILTETGVPSSASDGFMLLEVFININSYYQPSQSRVIALRHAHAHSVPVQIQ
jgi:hypothetical protein